jgi:uncharacterized integral membrane protein (TIGR00697 family)
MVNYMLQENIMKLESKTEKATAQFLMLFTMLYVTFNLVGCALLFKVVQIGPGIAPGGIFFLPIVLLIEDIVAEIFGYKISRALLWYILFSSLIFPACTVMVTRFPSPDFWHFDSAYHTVFDPLLRGGPALFLAVLIGRFINIYALTKSKILVSGKYFWIRSVLSTSVGGLVALIILCGLAYSNSVPFSDIKTLLVTDYIIRVVYAMLGGIPAAFIVIYLKKKYGLDTFDYNTNFNPFKIDLN